MGKRDPRVTAYIRNAEPFARPILTHLREVVHQACPEVVETIKWKCPSFEYQGMLCGMASFQKHCAFGFWKSKLILDRTGKPADEGMGQFGKLTKASDLPSKRVLTGYIKKAMELNEQGVPSPRSTPRGAAKPVTVPADLGSALAKNRKARAAFEKFSPSHRREYVEWITEAKREETRQRRLETTIEWLSEGKSRNWKHENC